MSDPLQAPAGSWWAWPVAVLYQADCLAASLLTGRRNTTISCLLGMAEDGLLGPVWRVVLAPAWWSVNLIARVVFGQDRHCPSSVGPFAITEDAP